MLGFFYLRNKKIIEKDIYYFIVKKINLCYNTISKIKYYRGGVLFKDGEKLSVEKAKSLSSIVLAFVGDAVHTLFVRENLATKSDAKTGELNKLSSTIVCAKAQAKRIDGLLEILTEEEIAVFKRARNAKKGAKAKNASVVEYNKATGFEAVIGFLYLTGNYERLEHLLNYEVKDEN